MKVLLLNSFQMISFTFYKSVNYNLFGSKSVVINKREENQLPSNGSELHIKVEKVACVKIRRFQLSSNHHCILYPSFTLKYYKSLLSYLIALPLKLKQDTKALPKKVCKRFDELCVFLS